MQELVSIIVTFYNNTIEEIDRCLNSVFSQSYQTIEVIVVDDGSKEQSLDRIRERINQEVHISVRLFENQHRGISVSRNLGIEKAKGQYLTFVDGDDALTVDAVEKLLDAAAREDADLVCASYYTLEAGKKKEYQRYTASKKLLTKTQYVDALNDNREITCTVWSKLFRTSCAKKISFLEDVFVCEDYFYNIQYVELAKKIVYIPEYLYIYVTNPDSITRSGYRKEKLPSFNNLMQIYRYIEKHYPENTDTALRRVILEEMSYLPAMCVNKNYDKTLVKRIQEDVKKHLKRYVKLETIKMYKYSAPIIAYAPFVFLALYRYFYVCFLRRRIHG